MKKTKLALLTSFALTCALIDAPKSFAEAIIHTIQINGNQRVESDTVLSYLRIKSGEEATSEALNQSLKALFETGFFTDVKIHVEGNQLIIDVMENPIINRIAYEGNSKLKDEQIKEHLQLRPREVLSRSKVQAAQQTILEMYRAMGRYGAAVEPKIIKLDENRCDVVFEIKEGESSFVRKINFIGNKSFSKSKLEESILTKRYQWFRFFASDDTYDPTRFNADQQNLRQYYYDHGHPDFQLYSAVAEITPTYEDFYLTFTYDEGKHYNFGKVDIASKIPVINPKDFTDQITIAEGEEFNAKRMDKTVEKITEALGSKGYAFVEVIPVTSKNPDTKKVDINFEIKEGPKVYIERIEVTGNDRTRDYVIRRELALHEGDAFNNFRIKKSERNLKDLGFFKNVAITVEQGSSPDKAVLVVHVEEQSTGEVSLSGGYSTVDGVLGQIKLIERNFMGKGQTVHSSLGIAKRYQDFDVGFIEPYLFDRRLEGSVDAFSTRSTRFSSYTLLSQGGSLGLGYQLTDNIGQVLNYTLKNEEMKHLSHFASRYIAEQKGSSITSSIGQTIFYDKRDGKIDATSGYILSMSNTWAGAGGKVKYLKHVFSGSIYASPIEDVVMVLRGTYGLMNKTGKRIRIVDSFFLGADSFRGFEYGGIGPRDTSTGDALGGRRYWMVTAESLFPIGLPNEFGVKGALFADVGSLWDSSYKGHRFVRDSHFVRSAVGFGIAWTSPMGPIRLDYSFPVRKDKGDDTQRILLSFKTKL